MKVDGLLSEPLARCLAVWQPHASSCFVASHESPGQYGVVYGMWVRLVILCTWANARKSNKKRREEKLIQFVLRVRGSAWVSKNYCLRERMIRYMPVQHYAHSLFKHSFNYTGGNHAVSNSSRWSSTQRPPNTPTHQLPTVDIFAGCFLANRRRREAHILAYNNCNRRPQRGNLLCQNRGVLATGHARASVFFPPS